MAADILAGSVVSWIKHLNVYTFLEAVPKENVKYVCQNKCTISFVALFNIRPKKLEMS